MGCSTAESTKIFVDAALASARGCFLFGVQIGVRPWTTTGMMRQRIVDPLRQTSSCVVSSIHPHLLIQSEKTHGYAHQGFENFLHRQCLLITMVLPHPLCYEGLSGYSTRESWILAFYPNSVPIPWIPRWMSKPLK